ncbi:4-galactosyl-N-acetylglucosaminide 3-alpha-L-fucosyltransferase FUT6-like [Engystomops pustulosus]|uniref:4-galactosyl-N-acetylglucosaminide 3-alpha-L-fucosyltransferase FUT6-like n=1 Tax=Engystomops pustulosus TaxID=76066 RepID=UPI003AFA8883
MFSMSCPNNLPKTSWIILFLAIYSYCIFVLCTFYYSEKTPEYKSHPPKPNVKMSWNCSIPPLKTVLPDHPRAAPQDQLKLSNQSSVTVILIWTWPLGHTFPLNQCPPLVDSSHCFFTLNRSMYSVAKAVVISHRDVWSNSQLPQGPRPPNQYWIWFSLEPPQYLKNLTIMDNLINMTMSFRADSDIFTPYGWLEKSDEKENFTIPQKTRLVAWVASNWKAKQRVEYYTELKKHIKVDVYGKGHLVLPRNQTLQTLSTYKFYLAFENSVHEDYITEKFWKNSFIAGTVPVVMGLPRKNYERFAPPDSFIHVDDFSSPKELASYLLSLEKDDQKYQQYFNWRSSYKPVKNEKSWVTEYCKVCKALKEAPSYRTIPSIAEWFK